MILSALLHMARNDGLVKNPAYEVKKVHYRLTVPVGGKLKGGLSALGPNEGRKVDGVQSDVPRNLPGVKRTGTVIDPVFLVDNVSFVLGMNIPGDMSKKPFPADELERRRNAFRANVTAAAVETRDEGLKAVDQFLADLAAGRQTVSLPPEMQSNHLIEFVYEPDTDFPVQLREAVIEYWSGRRTATVPAEGAAAFQCLVTGEVGMPSKSHPAVKGVPGGNTTGVRLVSFNAPAFTSYNLEQSENAPVTQAAADGYTEALKRLLSNDYPDPETFGKTLDPQNFRLSDDTAVVYWARSKAELVQLIGEAVRIGRPEAITSVLDSVWNGQPIDLNDLTPFYTLTLGGAEARAVVRGWDETSIGAVFANLRQYFADLKIARPPQDEGKPRPLLGLVRQLAVLGKLDNVPSGLAAELFAAILAGRPFTRAVLDTAVRRVRAERTLYGDRAAYQSLPLPRPQG